MPNNKTNPKLIKYFINKLAFFSCLDFSINILVLKSLDIATIV